MTSSTKASRVPEVGGGPRTSIFSAGSEGSISDQFMFGFGMSAPSASGRFLASAMKICSRVSAKSGPALGVREHDAVEADLHLDRGHAGGLAGLELAVLDAARGIGDVGRVLADAFAEELDAAAGAGRFHDRGREAACLAEALGNRGGEGEDGRGADDANLVAGNGSAGKTGRCDGNGRGAGE